LTYLLACHFASAPVNFHHDRTIGSAVMTSYRFFKMAAMASEIYFPVYIW